MMRGLPTSNSQLGKQHLAQEQSGLVTKQKNLTILPCGLIVFENSHSPGRFGPLKETCSKFCLVISGHARWECGDRRYMFGPDTVFHIPAGQTHFCETSPNDPVLTYALHYRPELLSPAVGSQLNALGMLSLDLSQTTTDQGRVVRSIFQEMLFEQDARHEGWEVILHSRLMDLAVRLLRLSRRRNRNDVPVFEPGSDSTDRVARYVLKLKAQFFRQETITEASRSVGLSRRQFTELFRKVTGQTWRKYILGLRLKHATGLLIETDRSVSAVVFESGFEDLSNFHHIFKAAHGCSPLAYREQRRVRIPTKVSRPSEPRGKSASLSNFQFRGMKGWFWTAEQYLEEISFLSQLKMNFLMDCYGSMIVSRPGEPWCNEWWRPMSDARKAAYGRIIRSCRENGITFCFALHPQLASPRPLDPGNAQDLELFFQHYAWAQEQGVQWFSICLDGTIWGPAGPAACGASHAALVNFVFGRLQTRNPNAQFVFCPAICWGDGSYTEHHAYLEVLAHHMHPEVRVFWNGNGVITLRVTRVAAESYKSIVKHRLFLWDNYPVNDGNPTLHLGPVSGRDADLCEVIDGYLSNPMCTQNQINRIPLATCADYAYNPKEYNPARSIGQAILRLGKTSKEQELLKDMVEAYPGFIVAGGGTGTNPVRAKFGSILAENGPGIAVQKFIHHIESLSSRLAKLFPNKFPTTKKTVMDNVCWMKQQIIEMK